MKLLHYPVCECVSIFVCELNFFVPFDEIMLGQETLDKENLAYLLQGNIAMDLERPNQLVLKNFG